MKKAARARARELRRRERMVQEAFDRYMDHMVESLGSLGIEAPVAMDAIFNAVSQLEESDVLPPFPEGRVSYQAMGQWLVAAADFGLTKFMVEAAQE